MTRVAVLTKAAVGTRYLAERERDPEREGDARRALFNHEREDLTPAQANTFLNGGTHGGKPDARDLLHLVVSPEQVAAFERLGDEMDARVEGFKLCTREMMTTFAERLGLKDVRWVAGVHLNTDHPHIHILIHRDATNAETGLPQRIAHLPREMQMHRRTFDKQLSKESPDQPHRQTLDQTLQQTPYQLRDQSASEAARRLADDGAHTLHRSSPLDSSSRQPSPHTPSNARTITRFDGTLGEAFARSLERYALPMKSSL